MTSIERLRELDRWLERKLAGESDDTEEAEEASDEQARRLLAHAGRPLEALARSPAEDREFGARLAVALAESGQAGPGGVIGPFRIEQAIGSGGMGVVYRACRVSGGFEQTVALKVLGGARPDEAAVGRFERERDLLSRLEHPGIARLIDGGLTADGRPWFAMEHIEGQPIDDYCRRHRLGIRSRLSLIRQVCEALDYAHGQMVLHRDIKPANILVDDSGRVRLVDFGLGGIQADLASGVLEATQLSRRWLTPEYASPEQLNGKAVDVRSEVYQLGLVLYRLLCAESPYETTGESPAEWIKAVTQAQPTAPSDRWLDNEQLAREFGSTRQTLGRRLRGDLDQIVLMALRKELERRYASVRVFGNDLDNYLEGRPVKARPDGLRYRMGKFVSRHPWGLAASALGLVIAIGAVFVHINRLEFERDRAQLEASKATMISDFLVELFESADPEHVRGPDLTVREVLEQGARQLEALENQPVVQAEFAGVLARAHRALGEYDQSYELASQAVTLQRRANGNAHPGVARALNNLGQSLVSLARFESAVATHQQALAIVRKSRPAMGAELAETLHYLGYAHHEAGDYDAAMATIERALAMRRDHFGESAPQVAETLNTMALTQFQVGDYEAARSSWQQALESFHAELGPAHALFLQVRSRLAAVDRRMGRYGRAIATQRDIVQARRGIFGERHPTVAMTLFDLGYALYSAGEYDEARRVWLECLDIQKETYAAGHPLVANTLQGLAAIARKSGNLGRAQELMEEVHRTNVTRHGERSDPVAASLNNLGTLRADRGDLEGSLGLYRQSLEIYTELYGEEHASVAAVLHRMGAVHLELEAPEAAEPLLRRALTIREAVLPDGHPRLAASRRMLEQFESVQPAPTED